jgi:hypothetical protein
MGKAILIFLVGSMIIFGIYNLYNNKNLKNSLQSSVNYYGDTESRNIGNTMMQMIFSQLADSNSWRVTTAQTKNFLNGSAQYTVVDTIFSGDTLVKANVYANYQGNTKTIVAYFHAPTSSSIPTFMDYALLTGSSLSMSGNISIVPDCKYSGNANVQANSNVSVSGCSANIGGFLTYTGSESGDLSGIVTPIVNPNGLSAYSQGPAVTIPTFSPNNYSNIATTTYTGNKTLSGAVTLGTKTNPAIIIIQGNLTLSSATFTGYGAILVTGNVALSGGNKLTTIDPQGSALGLYIAGNLAMSGNSEIDANMLVLGTVSMSGTPNIIGNIISQNPIALSGNVQLDYKPPVSSITQPFWSAASRPSDVRYYLE